MIHPVTPRDLLALRHKPYSRLYLYNEMMLAQGHNPALFALRCTLPFASRDIVTLVYRDAGPRGFVQARRRHGRAEVDLLYLAALPYGRRRARMPTDPDVWYRLVERLISQVGRRGVERIYAPLPVKSQDQELFRQLGFQPYTQRHIWLLREPTVEEGSALVALRSQARRDAFAIQQLYESLAPRVVQLAESRTSQSWQLPIARMSWGGCARRAGCWGVRAAMGLRSRCRSGAGQAAS